MFAEDFFTVDVLTPLGVRTYYVLFFIHIGTRKVYQAGITDHPTGVWLQQISRNMTMNEIGPMEYTKYLTLDRDSKLFDIKFNKILKDSGIEIIRTSYRSPDMNFFAERWIRSIKEECLDQVLLFRLKSLRYVIEEYTAHYNNERNHQGFGELLDF